jgi:primary-amine oxidase
MRRTFFGGVLSAMLVWSTAAQAQENSFKSVSPEQMQKILTGLNITYNVEKGGHVTFKMGTKYNVFLESFMNGKVLVASCNNFPGVTLERINQWNNEMALSRAILRQDKSKNTSYSRLEADINCELGVTPGMVDGFLKAFQQSVQEFDKFLEIKNPGPVTGNPNNPRENKVQSSPPTNPAPTVNVPAADGPKPGIKVANQQVEVAFPSAENPETVWKINWRVDARHGLVIQDAWLKREGKEWLKVLGDCRVAEIHVPYYLSNTRYFDMNVGGQASTSPLPITNELARPGQSLEGKAVLEIRDYGVAWMENRRGEQTRIRRGQELVLWAPLKADWYLYLIEFRFRDEGSISFRSGSTGNNAPKEPHIAHMHNTIWRLDIDLGKPESNGNVRNTVLWNIHKEPGKGQRLTQQSEFEVLFNQGYEGGHKWDPDQFSHPRIVGNQKNDLGNPISYELVPYRAGSARHFQDQEAFFENDFWVIPYSGYDAKTNNLNQLDSRLLPEYVKANRPIQNQDIVLWFASSALHVPRDEDMLSRKTPGVTNVVWSGFELRPRDLFSASPLYTRKVAGK